MLGPQLGILATIALVMAATTFFEVPVAWNSQSLLLDSGDDDTTVKERVRKGNGVRKKIAIPTTPDEAKKTARLFQRQLAKVSETMEKQGTGPSTIPELANHPVYGNKTVDISPLYDIVDVIIDTIGVRGLYFDVFYDGELKWWFADRPDEEEHWECWDTHGSQMCGPHEPWWFYHYIGAITAEKLVLEGRILWDPVKNLYAKSMKHLFQELHKEQELSIKWHGDMSYHAQHAILWQYAAMTMPNMDRFPEQMTKDLCGDEYAFRAVRNEADNKDIGYECFHGMGHAIFYVIVRQQVSQELKQNIKLSARTQFKPSAGLDLTKESWCKIRDYCSTGVSEREGYRQDAESRCIGGARHSVRIFADDSDMRWHYTTKLKHRNKYFDEELERQCPTTK
jgi:hypothetical protein